MLKLGKYSIFSFHFFIQAKMMWITLKYVSVAYEILECLRNK